jgi:hypothetical protein
MKPNFRLVDNPYDVYDLIDDWKYQKGHDGFHNSCVA